MSSAETSVERRFSKAARCYHEAAHLQARIASALAGRIKQLAVSDRVLDLGCGTGFLTAEIYAKNPAAEICAVDISPGMIEEARLRHPQLAVNWVVLDARRVTGLGRFDFVVSSSALQWMQPLESLFETMTSLLSSRGRLIFSVMVEGTLGELHEARFAVAPLKPVRRQLPTALTVKEALLGAGFAVMAEDLSMYRENYADARTFLRVIHQLGLTGGDLSQGEKRLSRTELNELEEYYQRRYSDARGGVYASYYSLTLEAKPLRCAN